MESLSKDYSFHVITDQSTDRSVIEKIGKLMHDFFEEIDYPYRVFPSNIFSAHITRQFRTDQRKVFVLLQEGNKPIGYANAFINIGETNRENTFINLYVKPEERKKGLGMKILSKCLDELPPEVKILSMNLRSDKDFPYYDTNQLLHAKIAEILPKVEGKHVFNSRRSACNLKEHNKKKVKNNAKKLLKHVHGLGYSVVLIEDINFSNLPFTRKQFVKFLEEINNDMPREGGTWEDVTLTEEDFLKWYEHASEDNMTSWIYVAVEEKTGLPVAMTETRLWKDLPEYASVIDTGVQRDHRGKKLGLTLKYQMLNRLLTDPLSKKADCWSTFNAASNKWMIAINDELGYKENALWKTYEFNVEKLKSVIREKM